MAYIDYNRYLEVIKGFLSDTVIGTITILSITLLILILAAFYIYHALAWMAIAKRLKYKYPWLAWIPFAKTAMILQLGRFHWAWIFLFLVPIIGWIALFVLIIIAKWRIFEKRKYPGWFSLAILIPQIGYILNMIAIAFLAWSKK